MHIHFEELSFKNILSYGASITTIKFENGLNLIVGKNGSGKSTFLDALSFCLYGKPYRRVRIEELINRKNKKNLWAKVSFKVNENRYEIERGRSPNILKILKNGEEMDELSTKALTQEELDRIIGIDYTMFKQIISLAVNYNKPFLSLNTGEKRSIVESIFSIKVFSEMMKIAKGKITGIRIQCDIDKKSLAVMEQNIRHLRKQIRELQIAIKDFQKNCDDDFYRLDSQHKIHEREIMLINKRINRFEIKLKKIVIDDVNIFREELEKLDNEIGVVNYKFEQLKKEKDLIDKNSICPFCHQEINSEHKILEEERIASEQKNIIEKQEVLNNNKTKILKHISKIEENKLSVTKIQQEIKTNKQKFDWLNKNIVNIDEQIKAVKERKIDFNIEQAKSDLEDKANTYTLLYDQYIEKNHELLVLENITTILSDNGIKSFFFRKYLPLLNKKINEYLRRFELSIHVEFNTVMDEKIWNQESIRKEVSYHTFSEGEKKRIDMSILLAFIDIAKTICNWNTNLLMFDELLDSAVDDDGLEQIISCLQNIIKSKQDKTIYVVSHRMRESDHFDHILMITKKQGFSTITNDSESS